MQQEPFPTFADPPNLEAWTRKDLPTHDFAAETLDPTVAMRAGAKNFKPRYNPRNLRPFRTLFGKMVEPPKPPGG